MFTALHAYCTEKTFAKNFSSDDESIAVIKCIIENCFITSSDFLSLHSLLHIRSFAREFRRREWCVLLWMYDKFPFSLDIFLLLR